MKAKKKAGRPKGHSSPGGSLPNSQTQKKGPGQTLPASNHRPRPYPMEVRRRAVQLHLEEGLTAEAVSRELGVAPQTVWNWAKQYRERGMAGLQDATPGPTPGKLPAPVREKIVALKNAEPRQGVRRISQLLRQWFWMRASPDKVRQELAGAGLMKPAKKPRHKGKPPPRRFERATPNQMWQSDITYYNILGKMAYIIAFLDDHSRYIVGLGVYRSHTSENVLEVYRRAVGEYGQPQEMLTDNGRQYANWRGKTAFQKELGKDHIHHIRSAPQHPETLGKIERLWKTLKDEFLVQARFETFDEARERLAWWVQYYNHRRPHQAMDGLCPADRFFSIQKEKRAAIERGVAANVEALARHGKVQQPLYMVGRVGEKTLVITTQDKRMSVQVDGQELSADHPLVYDLKQGVNHEGSGDHNPGAPTAHTDVQCEGKEPGGAVALERAAQRGVADEGDGCAVGRTGVRVRHQNAN